MKKVLLLFVFATLIIAQENQPQIELFFGTESATNFTEGLDFVTSQN